MSRKVYRRLVSLDQVLDIIDRYYSLKPLGIELVDLENALNRVLAEDIYAPVDHPPFDRSDVDGYAVRSVDTAGAYEDRPIELLVKGYVAAGDKPLMQVDKGEAVEVATGAAIPRGSDAVIMVEHTSRRGERVSIYKPVHPGENISTTGSDIALGDLVLLKGTILKPEHIGLLAGLGIARVRVFKRPRVAVFSSGNEVVEPGGRLELGRVYDVNGYLIVSMLREIGADARFYGLLPDDYASVRASIERALEDNDIIVTSGGTSAGLGDMMYRVFDSFGEPGVIIHGIKVKPGKPTVIAVAKGKLLIGLPGFPLSCYMIACLILKQVIAKLLGLHSLREDWGSVRARLAVRIRKDLGRTWLIPVAIVKNREGLIAYPVTVKSGSISPLYRSDGYAVLPEGRDLVLEGEEVNVQLFKPLERLPRLNIIGSNDILLYRLLSLANLLSSSRVIPVGSLAGWYAVKRGEADIAPTHLIDEETSEYNIPFLEKLGLRGRAVLIRGYDRRIGIVVKKGNPKGIKGIEDFLRDDVVIVNRSRGSGARVLLDMYLKRLVQERGMNLDEVLSSIKGYFYEVKTHTAVAAAVKHGRADAGIAIEYAALMYGLGFIPLAWEHFDFLVDKSSMEKKGVKEFTSLLKKDSARELVDSTPGYRAPENMGDIVS